MAKGLERRQLGIWRMDLEGGSAGKWGQVVQGFINHMLDLEN